jgi:hypothetical protein
MLERIAYAEKNNLVPGPKERNMIAVNLELCFAGIKESELCRKAVMVYLVGKDSVKTLTNAEILAFKKWLNVTQDEGGAWKVDPVAIQEAQAVYTEAIKAQRQLEIPF